jgi:hypothetical protein
MSRYRSNSMSAGAEDTNSRLNHRTPVLDPETGAILVVAQGATCEALNVMLQHVPLQVVRSVILQQTPFLSLAMQIKLYITHIAIHYSCVWLQLNLVVKCRHLLTSLNEHNPWVSVEKSEASFIAHTSIQCSHQPISGPYPEPDGSSHNNQIVFLYDSFLYGLLSMFPS